MRPMFDYQLDTHGFLRSVRGRPLAHVEQQLRQMLWQRLPADYQQMSRRRTNILEIPFETTTYLFDFSSGLATRGTTQDDRVVAVFGASDHAASKRDSSRMQQFLGGGLRGKGGVPMDKGHLVSHAQGGGLDINLFPQRPEVNRGWSGFQEWRAMERFCATNGGTFFFVRPIYGDDTWTPHALEYGVLKSASELWVRRFPN
jgi:hypothetical protein